MSIGKNGACVGKLLTDKRFFSPARLVDDNWRLLVHVAMICITRLDARSEFTNLLVFCKRLS